MRSISDISARKNENTHFVFNNFVQKSYRVRDKVEKYCRAGQGADDNVYGACALHAGYLRLQTHTHNM